MAILRLALVGLAATLGACSLVLDPDDLTGHPFDGLNEDVTAADTAAPPTDTSGGADTRADAAGPADTDVEDTGPIDAQANDTTSGPTVVIARPGVGGCELDYDTELITSCPETCPSDGGWTLVFDASDSVGVDSYRWSFSVTNNYRVTPEVATTARVEVALDVPSCELFGTTVGGALLLARLRVNGEEEAHSADMSFSVRKVSSCGGTQGNCPSPP